MRPNFTNRGNNRPGNSGYNNANADSASTFDPNRFKDIWITNEIDDDFIKYAEDAGEALANKGLTSSQIRNVYGEIKRIQVSGYKSNKTSFLLLKPKVAYNVGRMNSAGLNLFQKIFDKAWKAVSPDDEGRTYNNFCDVMEAILAYHRAKGGK